MNCLWEVMLKAKSKESRKKYKIPSVSCFQPIYGGFLSMPEPGHAGGHSCNRGQSILSVL